MHLLTSLVRSGLVCAAGSADSMCSSLSQHRKRFGHFSQFPWSVAKSRVDNSVEREGLQENTVYIDKPEVKAVPWLLLFDYQRQKVTPAQKEQQTLVFSLPFATLAYPYKIPFKGVSRSWMWYS